MYQPQHIMASIAINNNHVNENNNNNNNKNNLYAYLFGLKTNHPITTYIIVVII